MNLNKASANEAILQGIQYSGAKVALSLILESFASA